MPHDENDFGEIESQDWQIREDYEDARRIGAAARASFQAFYEGWQRPRIPADDWATQTTVEAQIAASSLGHKPLYFDPWPPQLAADLALVLPRVLPREATVKCLPSGLIVFRKEKVREILDADPAFYRPNGEDDLTAIDRVCASGNNGELLGYGARNWFKPHGARVTITGLNDVLFMFFVSNPREARYFARERVRDIASYTLMPIEYDISPP